MVEDEQFHPVLTYEGKVHSRCRMQYAGTVQARVYHDIQLATTKWVKSHNWNPDIHNYVKCEECRANMKQHIAENVTTA